MARKRRLRVKDAVYHVIARGVGRQVIFEESEDYRLFIRNMTELAETHGIVIIAYCLMDNHVHIMVKDKKCELSLYMARLLGRYAQYFNHKYQRVGHLFQDRFKSILVTGRRSYLEVYRYILANPETAGFCAAKEYQWSSYSDYYAARPVTDVRSIRRAFPDKNEFEAFITRTGEQDAPQVEKVLPTMDEEALTKKMESVVGVRSGSEIAQMPKVIRNEVIRTLRQNGFTIKQISRLTGLGRGVIQNVNAGTGLNTDFDKR